MFCANCGQELLEHMLFCPACGERNYLVEKSNEITEELDIACSDGATDVMMASDPCPQKEDSVNKQNNIVSYVLYGRKVSFPASYKIASSLMAQYEEYAIEGRKIIRKSFLSQRGSNPLSRIKNYPCQLENALDTALKLLESNSHYEYDRNRLLSCLESDPNFFSYYSAVSDIAGECQAVLDEKGMDEQNRQLQKAGRTKVVGGGFGLDGAVRGMMIAGAINATTGLFASLGNSIDRALCSGTYKKKFAAITNEKNCKKLESAWTDDCFYVLTLAEKIIGFENPYTKKASAEAGILQEKLKSGSIPDNDKTDVLVKALSLKPYSPELIAYAYETFGDDDGNLVAFCEDFGNTYNLRSIAEEKMKAEDMSKKKKQIIKSDKDARIAGLYDDYYAFFDSKEQGDCKLFYSIHDGEIYNYLELGYYISQRFGGFPLNSFWNMSFRSEHRYTYNEDIEENARESYLSRLGIKDGETLLFLFSENDRGRRGFAFTSRGLYINPIGILDHASFHEFNDIETVKWEDTLLSSKDLYFNKSLIQLNGIPKELRKTFVDVVTFLLTNIPQVNSIQNKYYTTACEVGLLSAKDVSNKIASMYIP